MGIVKKLVGIFVVDDRLLVTLFAILLILYGLGTFQIPQTVSEVIVGPTTFPRLIAVFGLILCAIFFFQKGIEVVRLNSFPERLTSEIVDLIPLWMALVYVLLFEKLGYLTATFLYVTITMRYLRERTWLRASVYGLVITILMFCLFYYGLLGELPRGEWVRLHDWIPIIEQIRSAIEN